MWGFRRHKLAPLALRTRVPGCNIPATNCMEEHRWALWPAAWQTPSWTP